MLITNENYIELLEADFSVLGFFPQEFKIKDVPINNARGLLLVTDGYYEWNLDRDNIWGFDNFKKNYWQRSFARKRNFIWICWKTILIIV